MIKRPLFCDACGTVTEHQIEDADDDGEVMALCSRCGRLRTLPRGEAAPGDAAQTLNSRTR